MPPERKRKKNEPRGEILVEIPVGCKARTGVDFGGPLAAGTMEQEDSGQAKLAGGVGSRDHVDNMRPMGALNKKTMVNNVEP